MTTTTPRGDIDEGVYRAIGDAWENDPAYRALFESDPRRALAGKGLELPAGVDVRVRANSADRVHFVLPPDPNAVLGDETLASVHGGVRASSAGSVGSASTVGCAPSCVSSAGTLSTAGSAGCE